ncbi:MAG: phosphatase PAP2 family protein [Candidatus Nanoarchaeia archaeon]
MYNKKRLVVVLLIIAVAIVLSLFFDNTIIKFISSLRSYYLNQLFLVINFLNSEIFIVIFLTLLLIWSIKKRKAILPLWFSIGVTAVVSVVLKVIVQRQRPFVTNMVSLLPGITNNIIYHTWDFSFPSFDSAFIFCTIPFVSKFYPKFKYIWIIFAGLVALSRLYLGLHYFSDILIGALIGYSIGFMFLKLEDKYKFSKKIYDKISK